MNFGSRRLLVAKWSQLMPAAQWLKLLVSHIPDKNEHLLRYYG